MTTPAIEVQDVKVEFELNRNSAGSFKEWAIALFKGQIKRDTLWALKGVSFSVNPGEIFGVIGPNGAGKSTLMKVIARVLPPTAGRVIVRGAVAPMIALGAGFNMELTARENIILYGTLLGRDPTEMKTRLGEIISWAELDEFVDVPVRTFSSGMLARLAFSIASDIEADVIVVDEVLSVGDESFRRKSSERMESAIENGAAIVLVSHALPTVEAMCGEVMWLDHGESRMIGPASEVVAAYKAHVEARK